MKRFSTAEEPAELPKVSPDDMNSFTTLLGYLGLSDEIVVSGDETNEVIPTEVVQNEKFNLHGPYITLQKEGKVAVHRPNWGYEYVLGENIYQQGIVHLKLKLEAFHNNGWLFVGIVKEDAVQPNNCYSYKWQVLMGGHLGGVVKYGKTGQIPLTMR